MNETRIYADAFETTFANTKEMLEFLAERAKASQWIRKPTRMLRLVPLEKEAETIEKACTKQLEGIVEDTEKNTQLVLKINGEVYPVRDCAMHTILKRAGVSGTGLRKLEKATYAKVINYCLKVARGDALIKIADPDILQDSPVPDTQNKHSLRLSRTCCSETELPHTSDQASDSIFSCEEHVLFLPDTAIFSPAIFSHLLPQCQCELRRNGFFHWNIY